MSEIRTVQTSCEHVRVEVEDGIGTIRIDRPKMNPLDIAVQDALGEAAGIVSADAEVRAVIIYGGEKVFAAGADIKEMQAMSYTDMVDRAAVIQECFKAVAHIPKPTIAAITGYALGAGCELAMCADFRIVGSDAKLGQPEILLGIIPGAGGTQRLARLVGPAKAKDLIYTGRFVDAEEALRIGLVDQVHPAAEVYERAVAWASRFVGGPSIALRTAKEVIDRGLEVDLQTGLEIERAGFTGLFATEDQITGMSSFIENGPGKATFSGQ